MRGRQGASSKFIVCSPRKKGPPSFSPTTRSIYFISVAASWRYSARATHMTGGCASATINPTDTDLRKSNFAQNNVWSGIKPSGCTGSPASNSRSISPEGTEEGSNPTLRSELFLCVRFETTRQFILMLNPYARLRREVKLVQCANSVQSKLPLPCV